MILGTSVLEDYGARHPSPFDELCQITPIFILFMLLRVKYRPTTYLQTCTNTHKEKNGVFVA